VQQTRPPHPPPATKALSKQPCTQTVQPFRCSSAALCSSSSSNSGGSVNRSSNATSRCPFICLILVLCALQGDGRQGCQQAHHVRGGGACGAWIPR
jgi:hypothetical protein